MISASLSSRSSLYAGVSYLRETPIAGLGLLFVQLFIIVGFIHHFNIEAAFNLPLLFPLVVGAFLAHLLVPPTYRPGLFLLATLVALLIVLSLVQTLVFLAIALSMIGVCNLPIALAWRKLILLFIAVWLAWLRFGYGPEWISSSSLTILSSMFMFRMLLFLYELKHQKQPVPLVAQISYFLMLPNVIFPLFPVIDYKLFQHNFAQKPEIKSYQRGVYLIAKGVLYLFLYRLIYSFWLPSRSDIESLNDLTAYIGLSYLLTIRLAGIFHFSVGVLHLFGYSLPDVFKSHFFASSFSDLWRRMNIYWKDFMIKLFFNPLYFKLKQLGSKPAIFIASIACFALTLLFHQYQTFWLTGELSISVKDVLFWGAFGVAVSVGSLMTVRHRSRQSLFSSLKLAAKVVVTFTLVALLWSMWSSDSLSGWLNMLAVTSESTMADWLRLALGLLLVIFLGACGHYLSTKQRLPSNQQLTYLIPTLLLALFIATFNRATLASYWNNQLAGQDIHRIFNFIQTDEDSLNEIAGYYDRILSTTDILSSSLNDQVARSKGFQLFLYQQDILYKSGDALKRRFTPNVQASTQGIDISVNQWGMYDEEHSLTPGKDDYRIAFLGGSIEMGWAIPRDQNMDSFIERQLNSDSALNHRGKHYEILNFSVPSRNIINQHQALKTEVLKFQPQMVVIFDHDETDWLNILNTFREYDYSQHYDGAVASVYQSVSMAEEQSLHALLREAEPLREPLFNQLYTAIYQLCIDNNMLPVIVSVPELRSGSQDVHYDHSAIAEKIGYQVIDLTAIFDRSPVHQWSMDAIGHPTLAANHKIANSLYAELVTLLQRQGNDLHKLDTDSISEATTTE